MVDLIIGVDQIRRRKRAFAGNQSKFMALGAEALQYWIEKEYYEDSEIHPKNPQSV